MKKKQPQQKISTTQQPPDHEADNIQNNQAE